MKTRERREFKQKASTKYSKELDVGLANGDMKFRLFCHLAVKTVSVQSLKERSSWKARKFSSTSSRWWTRTDSNPNAATVWWCSCATSCRAKKFSYHLLLSLEIARRIYCIFTLSHNHKIINVKTAERVLWTVYCLTTAVIKILSPIITGHLDLMIVSASRKIPVFCTD